ncbi:MAG: hypothetical protein ACW96U_00090 [Candidatus Heimdallarchaeaceae archaeon]|jgi:hypothetical protein
MAHQLAALWENKVSDFLEVSNDSVTIHYKPVRSGTDPTFDDFFQEGVDPSDPTNFSVNITETTPSSVTVTGKVHLDLYGASIGSGEGEQQLQIGRFSESDALFTCLLSDTKTSTDPDPIRTVFDDETDVVKYIVVAKDNKRYDIEAVRLRGMGATPFVVDVFLKITNKEI